MRVSLREHTSLSHATASRIQIEVGMAKVSSLSGVRTERSADKAVAGLMSDWLAFWDTPNSIYVSSRHKDVHYRLIAEQIAAFVPAHDARVLDYGSGEAVHADIVADSAGELLLSDGAPRVRAALAARFVRHAKIRALAPEDVERLPDHCVDLIVLHSVAQYLTREQTQTLFALFRRLLKSSGLMLVGDVIPPNVSSATAAAALLRFGAGNGFLFAALCGLVRTAFSDYRQMCSSFGLAYYSEAAMRELLAGVGFAAERAPKNLGHDQTRFAFVVRPQQAASRVVKNKHREE
jgi:SAM-dependent methyltransferase